MTTRSELAISQYRLYSLMDHCNNSFIEKEIKEGTESLDKGLALCESPIEKELLPWLIFGNYSPLTVHAARVHDVNKDDIPPGGSRIFISPQLVFGLYRIDFAVTAKVRSESLIVAVECDGRDFHDPVRDRKRDAFFAEFCIPTVRLTGSQIMAGPVYAAERVYQVIQDWSRRRMPLRRV